MCNDADHQAAMAFNEWKYQEGIDEYKQELRERVMELQHTWLLETYKMVKLDEVLKLLE